MRIIVWLACLFIIGGGGMLHAAVNVKVKRAVEGSFASVEKIEAEHLILSKKKASSIQKRAKAKLDTKLYRYYRFVSHGQSVGYGVLIARKVRTKKATVLYAFDPKGKLRFAEIMAFGEAPEYLPSDIWMQQFKQQPIIAPLKLGKDIPTVSGATLTARSISEGARIARAILLEAIVK